MQGVSKEKYDKIFDASAYFCPGGGSQFEGYPLPSSKLLTRGILTCGILTRGIF
jgi:hypothetical protein